MTKDNDIKAGLFVIVLIVIVGMLMSVVLLAQTIPWWRLMTYG